MNMTEVDDFKGLWERVIRPTIMQKYVTVRCNLNSLTAKWRQDAEFFNGW